MIDGAILQSPWLTRDLVPRQPSSMIQLLNGRLSDLREEEAKEHLREAVRQKPLDMDRTEVSV